MRQLKLAPEIFYYETFKEFNNNFQIGLNDLVLTHEFLHKAFISPLGIKSNFIFQEKYGVGEPSDEMIDLIYEDIKKYNFNRVIAFGGGTIIDIAKLYALKIPEYSLQLFEKAITPVKEKELILIPTTCGTGSEVTNISIAEIKSKNTKMGLADDSLYADYAVLIPETIKDLPDKFFAISSIDALIHACESYVSPKSNPYTELFAEKATRLILKGYMKMATEGNSIRSEYLKDFMLASNYAGIAFGNAGVGAVHALSYSIGGAFHVPHGEANYAFFTEVFKIYDLKNPEGKIKELKNILYDVLKTKSDEDVFVSLERLLSQIISKKNLKEYGMTKEQIDLFTKSTIQNQQRLLANNYVELTEDEIKSIFSYLY